MSYPTKLTAKQQFLQPFELLHDTLEQTKALKTTLDDQIRRSATLLQGLPSASTVESLVRRQVQDYYQTVSFEDQVEECRERVMALEQRVRSSPLKEVIAERTEQTEPSENILELMKRLDYLEQKIDQRQA
ncbi:hypothetical protein CLU79DRAFT_754295 [Phycomyces nitens]|nr:hypothetical protein CLU79DRAFT_754295 [Phycomyces nitens]